jgi:hypothetical protein
MKDEKRKRLKLKQVEDSMGNGVNVMIGGCEFETASRERRGEAATIKEGSKQASSRSE